jgi:hypothetical protein
MSARKASRQRAPDWVAIRRLYEESTMPVAEIAELNAVTYSAIRNRRLAENWKPRSKKSRTKVAPARRGRTTGRSGLVSRLLKVVDQNLKLLEMRMETDEPGTAADRERETRAIGALTRTIEKLTELQSEAVAAPAKPAKTSSGTEIDETDADRLRLEIAERILRIGERYASR